ncbi:MAG: hypothetical protein JWP97_5652 [Labilithrix sp.]|nr:hypothetical protein [Labilithrix sp.]
MTAAFYPAFEPKLGVVFAGDGAPLFHHAALLDALCEERGVPLLSSFADDREPPPDFDGFPEDLHDAIGPWTAWFSPTDGIRCVEALLAALAEPGTIAGFQGALDGVVRDLEALHDVLSAGKKRRARFRLEIA